MYCIILNGFFFKYIKLETDILNCNNISQYYFILLYVGEYKRPLSKAFKNPTDPKLLNGCVQKDNLQVGWVLNAFCLGQY